MEGARRYPLVIPPEADSLDVADHQGIISLTCEDPTSTEEVPMCIGQCWSLPWLDEELGSTSVYEILSFNEQTDYVSLLQWKSSTDLTVGNRVTASPYTESGYHCGTITLLRRPVTDLTREDRRTSYSLVALGVEEHRAQIAETWSKIIRITPRTMDTTYTRWSPLQACPELHMVFEEAQLYTDGSTVTEGTIGDFLRGKETTKSTGAIVGTDDGDTFNAIRLDFVSLNLTSFLTELTTLMYARLRSNSNIASDCQKEIKTLQRAKSGRRPKGIQGHITAKYSLQSVRERTEAFWVQSHSELDKNKNGRWTPHDFGIWLSDGVAGKEMVEGTYKGKTISSLTVVDGDRILKDLFSRDPNRMHITTLGGGSVLLDPIKTVVQRRCFDKYCATRNGYRAKAFKPPRWTDCTGPWAGRLYGTHKSQTVNVGTTCTKIIYDKHLHGENLAKIGAPPYGLRV